MLNGAGPTPHGVGGLKLKKLIADRESRGPTPHGVGGLKSVETVPQQSQQGPTPHGVGGLKWAGAGGCQDEQESHPTRGGWIEICRNIHDNLIHHVPPHTGWVD